tara:strand:- start:318 stop:677 length:360 start_codon:yes stop_codon:yes gene_type:complete
MIKIENSAGLVCSVVVLILALCMLRFHILQKERFFNEGLFNNKLTKEFVKNFKYTYDCSPVTFKKKMVNYFKLVKQYREQETELYNLNHEMKTKYDNYSNTMKELNQAKTDLEYCTSTN